MTPQPSVSAEDLERWADRHEAAAVLPELVRRLLLATVAIRELEIRAGKAVYFSGFDGVVVARRETAFCPEGYSVWELSTRSDVKKKLDEDYRERREAPGTDTPRHVTFMLVTARRFSNKTRWMERANADRRWRRVRVLDGDDLATWLEQAPLVAAWFSHVHLDRPVYSLESPEDYLRSWSRQTRPALPPALLLKGREDERRRIEQWLDQIEAGYEAPLLRIVASSRDEARVFFLATIDGLPPARRNVWFVRCTVVNTADAWRWAVRHASLEPWLLVPTFHDDAMVTGTTDRSTHAILPLDGSAPNRAEPNTLVLHDPLPWRAVEAELRSLSIDPGNAERIARETKGDLPALRQRLGFDGLPPWIQSTDRTALVAMMLVGAWTPTHEVDAWVVRQLGVKPKRLDQICAVLANEHDAPIERLEATWQWKSHATAWDRLHSSLTPTLRRSFAEIAIEQLTPSSTPKPTTALASTGPRLRSYTRCSSAMESGIVASLGYDSQRTRGSSNEDIATRVVREVLAPRCDHWIDLSERLSDLAEAAPRAFLDALDDGLRNDASGFAQWLDHQLPFTSGHLLRALQILAWGHSLTAQASALLLRLAALSHTDRATERSIGSLCAIYDLFSPQTRLPDNERLETLRTIVGKDPSTGWRLLLKLIESLEYGGGGVLSPRPRLLTLDEIPTEPPLLTHTDLARRVDATVGIAIDIAGANPQRWRDLLTKRVHRSLHNEVWHRIRDALRSRRDDITHADTSDAMVWSALRGARWDAYSLQKHSNGVRPEWIRARITDLEELYQSFEPTNIIVRHAWLFQSHRALAEPSLERDGSNIHSLLEQRRDEALSEILQNNERPQDLSPLIQRLSRSMEDRAKATALNDLAYTLAHSDFRSRFEVLYLQDDPGAHLRAFVPYFARQVYYTRGRDLPWLEALLRHWLDHGRHEDALRTTSDLRAPEIWDLLDRLGDPLRDDYLRTLDFVPGDDATDWERVVKSLLRADNTPAAIHTARLKAQHLKTHTIMSVLRAARSESRSSQSIDVAFGRDIETLLSTLDERNDLKESPEDLAMLELELLEWLDSHYSRRGLRYIPALLKANASYFVDLLCRAYPREDATDVPALTDTERIRRAAVHLSKAYAQTELTDAERTRRALRMWNTYPGNADPDPDAREQALFDWGTKALELAGRAHRARVGQTEVAKVLARAGPAEDGHWPSMTVRKLLASSLHPGLDRDLLDARRSPLRAYWVSEGGRDEHEQADRYQASATALRARWPATASMLDDLAKDHRHEALYRDQRARRERLAHGQPASGSPTTAPLPQNDPMVQDDNATAPPSAIHEIALADIGPSGNLRVELAARLNIIAGDNGVGKTFLLDVLWWCLTGTWCGHAAWPSLDARERVPTIRVIDANGELSSSVFDRTNETWPRPTGWPPTLAPVLYVRLDGQFALWDPLRNRGSGAPAAYEFTSPWDRLEDDSGTVLCNGLVDDWRDWAQRSDETLFKKFFGVVKDLMPPEEQPEPSGFVKLSKRSATRVPQIRLRHGVVPIEHLSAGMKRVLGIAYLLIWAWDEHLEAARLEGTAPANQIVILIDEVEAHLHPKWQRTLMPALLRAVTGLGDDDLSVQVVATTHSPLVLASLEPHFVHDTDQLLHLGYDDNKVRIEEIPWAKHGNASAWLESPVLDLERSTSPELERVLEEAQAFLDDPGDATTRTKIDRELRRLLPAMDPFWLQWETPVDEASQ